ncbi:hypothetical protein [Butyricicoccus sp. Marseille-Q5471]|uniref:hypothetical protein n=1 Tax=Butyricicoccus sp. Marseille-Q5471 TaxID=3039493 RepID=UPI0024BCBF9F|nr:hypothetical protein [Butyricicoccus sp. Marseille-Q5471]
MEKAYPNWQYAFAGVMWAVMSAALYLLHYKVYGGLLLRDDKQLLWMLILLPPVLAVTIGMREQNELHTPRSRGSLAARLYTLLCIVIAVCGIWVLVTEPYRVLVWAWAVMALYASLLSLPRWRGWRNGPIALGLLFGLVLATVGVFLLVIRPVTVGQAEAMLSQRGYTARRRFPVDKHVISSEGYLSTGEHISYDLSGKTDPLGFYGFLAHRDGARWCVAVSVAQGSVEIEQRQDETVPAV